MENLIENKKVIIDWFDRHYVDSFIRMSLLRGIAITEDGINNLVSSLSKTLGIEEDVLIKKIGLYYGEEKGKMEKTQMSFFSREAFKKQKKEHDMAFGLRCGGCKNLSNKSFGTGFLSSCFVPQNDIDDSGEPCWKCKCFARKL